MASEHTPSGTGAGDRGFRLNPLVVAMIGCGALACSDAMAANITVTDGGDAGDGTTCTLRQAIESANTNAGVGTCTAGDPLPTVDTVSLAGQAGTITLGGTQIVVTESVALQGPGATQLAISGGGASRVFLVDDAVGDGTEAVLTIDALTLRDGRVTDEPGGCILATDNNDDGIPILRNSVVTGCQAVAVASDFVAGGAIAALGDKYAGGTGSVTLQNSTVTGNSATHMGGGVFGYAAYILESVVSDNTVTGAQVATPAPAKYTGGGGVSSYVAFIRSSTISGNRVSPVSFTLADMSLSMGGGVLSGVAFILDSTVSQNTAHGVVNGREQTDNYVVGGGLAFWYGAVIQNSTISGNLATASPAAGVGAVSHHFVHGGGVFLPDKYDVAYTAGIYNTTIAGNRVERSGVPGATYLMGAGGIGFFQIFDQSPLLYSSIVSGSGGGPDIGCLDLGAGTACDPLTLQGAFNLVETIQTAPPGSITLPPGTLRVDPQLGPLADNGGTVAGAPGAAGTGPLPTHGLLPFSPAENTGDVGPVFGPPLDNDERGPGHPRVLGPAADIGAFEGVLALARSIPTLGTWATAILALLLGLLGARRLRCPGPLTGPHDTG